MINTVISISYMRKQEDEGKLNTVDYYNVWLTKLNLTILDEEFSKFYQKSAIILVYPIKKNSNKMNNPEINNFS